MREKKRILRMLEERLEGVEGQAGVIEQERQRLQTAIEVVRDLEEGNGTPSADKTDPKTAILKVLKTKGPQTRAELVDMVEMPATTVDSTLHRLTRAGDVARENRLYRATERPATEGNRPSGTDEEKEPESDAS